MQVYQWPIDKFVAGFIGSPPMNFIPGKLHMGTFKSDSEDIILYFNESGLKEIENQSVQLGIRPEDIHLRKLSNQFQPATFILEVLEPLGNESILHLSCINRLNVVSRTHETEVTAETGSPLNVYIDIEQIHFFDD